MRNKSSVEWLGLYIKGISTLNTDEIIEQAKEMHKQEILDAWEDGQGSFPTRNAEQYYTKTFGK